jgi:hypothetical protein
MFRIPLRASSSATPCASRMQHRALQFQQLGTRAAPSSVERVRQPVQQLQAAQSSKADGVSSSSPVRQAKSTRTEELIWLVKQSLAASVSSKKTSAATSEVRKHEMSLGKREEPQQPKFYTEAWDVPTIWAHLW